MAITHLRTSVRADGPDPLDIQPSDWLDDHVIAAGTITPTMLDAATQAVIAGSITENGFTDRTSSTIAFVDGTMTFTLSPLVPCDYWQAGAKYTFTIPKSVAITDVEGLHFFFLDGATLATTPTFSDALITDYALVGLVYWDSTANTAILFGDERHGRVMDSRTHLYRHLTAGSQFASGLGLNTFAVDGSGALAVNAQFGVQDGIIWDEDIQHTITSGSPQTLNAPAQIPVYYRLGAAGNWRKVAATVYPIATTGTGRPAWNQLTGGSWQLKEVTANDFVLTHYYATNDQLNPIVCLAGQASYATLALARAGAMTELASLSLGPIASLGPEFVAIATVIWESKNSYANAVKARIRSNDLGGSYIDWRVQKAAASGVGGVTDHNQLSALQGGAVGEYYHVTAAQLAAVQGLSASTNNPIIGGLTSVAAPAGTPSIGGLTSADT